MQFFNFFKSSILQPPFQTPSFLIGSSFASSFILSIIPPSLSLTHTHYHSLSLVCQFSLSLSLSLSLTHTHTHTQSFSLFPGMPININANNTSLETSFSITRQKPLSVFQIQQRKHPQKHLHSITITTTQKPTCVFSLSLQIHELLSFLRSKLGFSSTLLQPRKGRTFGKKQKK